MAADPPQNAPQINGKANAAALIGKRLGRFKVTGVLGRGAMGLVLLAEDVTLRRRVALKLLPYNKAASGKERVYQEQFIREARSAAGIIHPAVVQIFEVGIAEGFFYIAMEVLESGSLDGLVELRGPLDWPQAVEFCAQAAEGLAYAHDRGILHRDIKPANLMLADSGHCKVADFGLAHIDDPTDDFKLPWKVVGTPYFMAPEVARGDTSAAGDIFALAGVLWYLLTGKPPFAVTGLQDVVKIHKEIALPDLTTLRPDLPPRVVQIIERALSYDADRRQESAAELATELRRALNLSSTTTQPVGESRRTSKPKARPMLVVAIGALALIGVGVGVGVALFTGAFGGSTGASGPVIIVEPINPNTPIHTAPPPRGILPNTPGPSDGQTRTPGQEVGEIPPGGESMLAGDALSTLSPVLVDGNRRFGRFERVSVTGQPFRRAARTIVSVTPTEPRLARLEAPVTGEVFAGRSYLLSFQLRAEPPSGPGAEGIEYGRIEVQVERARPPYQPLVVAAAGATRSWQRIDVPFTAGFSLPHGLAELRFHLGTRSQTIEIADVKLLDFGKDVAVGELPRTASLAKLTTPTPSPMPQDAFGTFNADRDAPQVMDIARSGDPRPYLFSGTIHETPARDGADWVLPLTAGDGGVAVVADADLRGAAGANSWITQPAALKGKQVVAFGTVRWVDRLNRPAVRVAHPTHLRTVTFAAGPFQPSDRSALIDAALFGRQVVVRGKATGVSLIDHGDAAEVRFAGAGDDGLALRYGKNLFDAMTTKFGGTLGDGIVGKSVELQITPRYDPVAGALTGQPGTTKAITDLSTAGPPSPKPQPPAAKPPTAPQVLTAKLNPAASEPPDAVAFYQAINGPLEVGDEVIVSVRAKSPNKGTMTLVLQRADGTTPYQSRGTGVAAGWQEHAMLVHMTEAQPAGGVRLGVHLNHRAATIEIARVELFVNGKAVNWIEDNQFAAGDKAWQVVTTDRAQIGFAGGAKLPAGKAPAVVEWINATSTSRIEQLIAAKVTARFHVMGTVSSRPTKRAGELLIFLQGDPGMMVVCSRAVTAELEKKYGASAVRLRGKRLHVAGTIGQEPRKVPQVNLVEIKDLLQVK